MINIPLYRAKRKDNGEYIEGYFNYGVGREFGTIIKIPQIRLIEIDPSTLAIHFPDMKDKNDKPIFASLMEDGVGGDYIECSLAQDNFNTLLVRMGRRHVAVVVDECGEPHYFHKHEWKEFEVTGIYEGETR